MAVYGEKPIKQPTAEQAAANSNARSAWELAKIYTKRKQYQLALPYLEQAVSGDISSALLYLAAYYLNGWGVAKNANSAFSLYLEAAKREEKEAYYSLALLYKHGVGTEKNLKKAWYWAAKSLAEGIEVSKSYAIMEEYANWYNEVHADEIAAEKEKRKKAEQLAERKRNRQIQRKNQFYELVRYESEEKIVNTLMQMWNRGDVEAGAVLSEYLANNRNFYIGSNRAKQAYECAEAAADKGCAAAMRLLADYHFNGLSVARDLKKALAWADRAVKAGDDEIGLLWPMIRGAHDFELLALPALEAKNYKGAFKPLYNAANLGHPGAMFHMGRLFEQGWGVKADKDKAADCHSRLMMWDRIVFGRYRQENGYAEPIRWRIIARGKDRALLISEKILDCRKYHSVAGTGVTWENSDLRRWLNSTFVDSAFSRDERMSIMRTAVTTPENPGYSTNPGKLTYDEVFVLSAQEAAKYLDGRKEPFLYSNSSWGKYYLLSGWHLNAPATSYACREEYGSRMERIGKYSWWLRTPGKYPYMTAAYMSDGWRSRVVLDGMESGSTTMGVRPAIWVRLYS